MSSIGPQLPPHLTKRKRSPEDESPDSPSTKTSRPNNENETALDGEESDSDDGYGPSAPRPAATAGPQRPSIGPSLPPTAASGSNTDEIALNSDSDDDDTGPAPPPSKEAAAKPTAQRPRRVMGPAPPPADLASRPTTAPDSDSDSDSDDDYGPALPGAASANHSNATAGPSLPRPAAAPEKPARDDWMLAPPEPTGYQERDPTKIKARKFASGAGATSRPAGGGGGISKIWTETPEEKAKRLADAVLGRGGGDNEQQAAAASKGSSRSGGMPGHSGAKEDGQQEKIRAFTEQTRGKSLYEQHQTAKKAGGAGAGSGTGKKAGADDEEDDDPSKRAFDREKDMGLGMKITASQRKELLNRASDFGGRFSKGNYL
ncbi:hypothetical protein INS49_002611 [Diaporthe citri]|uniref:uncharacterized protein n=1 Tax=Diaporthe citri TaxID=83186 RepID=UPI001C7E6E7C|nr:uncharacterized protein INS49_002611 [Diaporthe citri]KAG6368405.1 hypothetical protein INS49_002611 [Diaporthe citri]